MLHKDRRRAEAFGAFADDYDRFRPSYPDALFDALGPFDGSRVLDVGCGTGKAARRLAEKGAAVLGIELDARMAAVAANHGIKVEVASFESWEPNGRTFDLVTSGQAWHWVDPVIGPVKAAEVLSSGGRLTAFWNYGHPRDRALEDAIERTFDETVPELAKKYASRRDWRHADEMLAHQKDIDESGRFEPCELQTFPWEWRLAADDWLSLLRTHSDVALLSEKERHALLDGLTNVVKANVGDVVFEYETVCLLARRAT